MRVIIGGPSYEMRTDARHTVAVAALSAFLARKDAIDHWNYRHGVPVEMARNGLFEQALNEVTATHLIWMDSDVYFDGDAVMGIWNALRLSNDKRIAFMGVPCPLRGDQSIANVWINDGKAIIKLSYQDAMRTDAYYCAGMGLGFAIFNLQVYRKRWADGPWFYTQWLEQNGGHKVFCSEDLVHTGQLIDRVGQAPLCYPCIRLTHAERGGPGYAPTIAGEAETQMLNEAK